MPSTLQIWGVDKLKSGIRVHIADVSYFVQHNANIDTEAQRRCTTVYLVDRAIPMLPRVLCDVACSLTPNEWLAISCVWTIHRDGTVVKNQEVWYGRSIIKSCTKTDYATAHNIVDRKRLLSVRIMLMKPCGRWIDIQRRVITPSTK